MKIAYICSDIDIVVFGKEGCAVHITQVAEALARAGHEVRVICACLGQDSLETRKCTYIEIQPQGLDQTALQLLENEPIVQEHRLERDLRSVLFNSWFEVEAAKLFEHDKPDLIYERFALFGWTGLELRRRFGIPLILEVNAPLCDEQEGYDRFTLVHTAREMESAILRGADAIVSVSDWLKTWMMEKGVYPSQIHVIPNGVSPGLFTELESGDAIRGAYDLIGKRVIGYVGSFQPWHDVARLFNAFAELYREDSGLRLLLVGEGDLKKSIQRRAAAEGLADAVKFTGHVPHEKIAECFAAMDLAVVPYTRLPNFYFSPMKLFESMAAGIPTVAADIGQIRCIVEHGQTGWLYSPGDHKSLVEVVRAALYHPERSRIGEAARRKILAEHNWDTVAAKIITIAQLARETKAVV